MTVGAALRGRPCAELTEGRPQEGRPYSTFHVEHQPPCYRTFVGSVRILPKLEALCIVLNVVSNRSRMK